MKEYEQYKGDMKAMKDLGIYKRDDWMSESVKKEKKMERKN